jgi:hypothetical protein
MEFAKAERPGFLGFGSGNTRQRHFWNYSGSRNNLYFARSVFKFLSSKAATQDGGHDKVMRAEARGLRKGMLGDGGGFGNIVSVAFTQVTSLFGKLYKPTPYRSWSDEAVLDSVGRSLDIGLMLYGGSKLWNALGEVRGLRRLQGWRGVGRAWREARREGKFNPVPAWREARLSAEKKVAELAVESQGPWARLKRKIGDRIQERLFKGLPPLSAQQKARLQKLGHHPHGFINKLTKAVVMTGVAGYADKKLQAYYNPFELNHETSLDRYPDPTRPDPALRKPPKKNSVTRR